MTTSATSNDPVSPSLYQICGVYLNLSGRSLPNTYTIPHPLPEALLHFSTLRREANSDADVSIVVGAESIRAHKDVLAARIPYMRRLFDAGMHESSSGEIDLTDSFGDASIIRLLIEYAYTGTIVISESTAPLMMLCSNYLEMLPIVEECASFMHDRLNVDNVLSIRRFFNSFAYEQMDVAVGRFIDKNFVPISRTVDFLDLSSDDLVDLIERDTLNVDDEKQIFEAVTRWMEHDQQRRRLAPTVMMTIRLALLCFSFLTETVEKTEWVAGSDKCTAIVRLAKEFVRDKQIRCEIPFTTTKRKCEEALHIFISFDPYSEIEGTTLQLYNPIHNSWTESTSPVKFDPWGGSGVVVVGSKAYFVGGCIIEGACHVYDAGTHEWEQHPPSRHPRDWDRECAKGVIGDRIFLAGGMDGETDDPQSLLLSMDLSADTPEWTTLRPMSKARIGPASCVLDGRLYVIGGRPEDDSNDIHVDGEYYDPATDRWTPIASRKLARDFCSAAVYNGRIYVVGYSHDDVERYDPATDSWTIRAGTKTKEVTHLLVSCGRLFAMDGIREGDGRARSIMMYDEEKDEWERVAKMPPRKDADTVMFMCAMPVPAIYGCQRTNLEVCIEE